jgi:hypothetical protein
MLNNLFADEIHRATYTHKVFKEEACAAVLRRYRVALRGAQRIVLDDDAVRLACQLSTQREKLDLWSVLARLPYEKLWIEFDLLVKLKEWARLGTLAHPLDIRDVPRKCGYLLHLDAGSETRWVAHEFVGVEGLKSEHDILPQPVSFVFDPNGSPLSPVTGSTTWNTLTISKRDFPRVPVTVWNRAHTKKTHAHTDIELSFCGDIRVSDEEPYIVAPDWTLYRVGVVHNPLWAAHMGFGEKAKKCIAMDAAERTGVFRWLITALAMINDVPKTMKAVRARPGRMSAKLNSIKYFDHHIVTIKVPKGTAVRFASREMTRNAIAAHRARHQVRGHWRIIESGLRTPILCRHEPTEIDGSYAMCQRCERLLRWIPSHHRGDARLGFIKHDYLVEA